MITTLSASPLLRDIETLPPSYREEVSDFVAYLKRKYLRSIAETALLSEASLAKEWDTPEEDTAWETL
jgi:hypothetical protein